MTVEERAKESWWNSEVASGGMSSQENYVQGYIAGYKQGRADESINAVEQMNSKIKELHSDLTHKGYAVIQWHKVADGDLPKENRSVISYVQTSIGYEYIMAHHNTEWYSDSGLKIEPPIAWTEIPTFTE